MRLGIRMSLKCQRCNHAVAYRNTFENRPTDGVDCQNCGEFTDTIHHVFSFTVLGENPMFNTFPE